MNMPATFRGRTLLALPDMSLAALSGGLSALLILPATRIVTAAVLGAVAVVALGVLVVRRPVAAVIAAWVALVAQAVVAGLAESVNPSVGAVVSHIDEATLAALVLLLTARRVMSTEEVGRATGMTGVALLVAAMFALGCIASVVDGPGMHSVLGAWYDTKFWLVLWLAICVPWKEVDAERLVHVLTVVGLIVAAFGVVDFFAPTELRTMLHTPLGGAGRFRGDAVQSVFARPGAFSEFMSLMFALCAGRYATHRRPRHLVYACAFLVMSCLSLRLKSALAPIAVLIVILSWRSERIKARSPALIAGVLFAFLAVAPIFGSAAIGQIQKFATSGSDTPRGQLYSVGSDIAEQTFPLGAGYGRFGEFAATQYYSPWYVKNDFQHVYGFSPSKPQDLTDTSWPAIYAETGFVGFGFAVAAFLALLRRLRRPKPHPWQESVSIWAAALLSAYLINSLGSPSLFNSLHSLTVVLVIGAALQATAAGHAPKTTSAVEALRRPPFLAARKSSHRAISRSAGQVGAA